MLKRFFLLSLPATLVACSDGQNPTKIGVVDETWTERAIFAFRTAGSDDESVDVPNDDDGTDSDVSSSREAFRPLSLAGTTEVASGANLPDGRPRLFSPVDARDDGPSDWLSARRRPPPPVGIPKFRWNIPTNLYDNKSVLQGQLLVQARTDLEKIEFQTETKQIESHDVIEHIYNSRSAVFRLKSIPNVGFKVARNKDRKLIDSSGRMEWIHAIATVLDFYNNPPVFRLPKSQLITFTLHGDKAPPAVLPGLWPRTWNAIAERQEDIDGSGSMQQYHYETAYEEFAINRDLKEDFLEMFEWLAKLVSVVGFHDIRWANIPLSRDHKSIVLVDLESMANPYRGLIDLLLITHPVFYDPIMEVFIRDRRDKGPHYASVEAFREFINRERTTRADMRQKTGAIDLCDDLVQVGSELKWICYDTIEDMQKARKEVLELRSRARGWYLSNSLSTIKERITDFLAAPEHEFNDAETIALGRNIVRDIRARNDEIMLRPDADWISRSPSIRSIMFKRTSSDNAKKIAEVLRTKEIIFDFRELQLSDDFTDGRPTRVIHLQY